MNSIINKITNILNNMTGIKTTMFDNNFSANLRVDRAELPGALLYTVPDWNINIANGVSKEQVEVQVFFFDKGEFDSKSEDKLPVFANMALLAREFISKILSDKTLLIQEDSINIKSVYARWDKFVVGCTLTLRLIERQGDCIYTEPTPMPTPIDNQNEDNEENEG